MAHLALAAPASSSSGTGKQGGMLRSELGLSDGLDRRTSGAAFPNTLDRGIIAMLGQPKREQMAVTPLLIQGQHPGERDTHEFFYETD